MRMVKDRDLDEEVGLQGVGRRGVHGVHTSEAK